MNSPEEKAKELLNKIEGSLDGSLPTGGDPYLKETVAIGLICVDEIIALLNGDGKSWDINCYWNGEKFISSRDTKDYYQKVKEEIQKLRS